MKTSCPSVVLTGATGGIGAATAAELVRSGARVLLVARSRQPLASLARELADSGPPANVEAMAADITTSVGRRDIAALAEARGVNVLINCAGVPCFGSLQSADEQGIADVLTTNLIAPIQLARTLLPVLAKRPGACILNVGSALGALGIPGFSVYCASKFGLRGFTEALRRELAGSGVRVQYLAPRSTRTRFNDSRVDEFNRVTGTRSDPPHAVAKAIVRMLGDGGSVRALGFPERLAARLNGFAPKLLDAAFKRHRAALHRSSNAPTTSRCEESR
jgi:short-subunit dehydrogenase